ncbi:MAG: hypothetical protein IT368_11500 [Candidatus Hydrogenedentes bacterium]|nr:hypothetical protein [Candidatus Hydrogenedentota bacterium]
MSKFKGVAYWSGNGLPADWPERAIERLAPARGHGCEIERETVGIRLRFGEDGMIVPFMTGQSQGAVPQGKASGALAVCMMGLARNPGGIALADDEGQILPTLIRQSHPLFGADWERVQALAEALGMMPGRDFMLRHGETLRGLI